MMLLKDFYGPFDGMNPCVVGLEAYGSSHTHLKTKKMIAEQYQVRHFSSTQQALAVGELENAYWLPGAKNPADGLTNVRCDVFPLLRLLESVRVHPGQLSPLKRVTWEE